MDGGETVKHITAKDFETATGCKPTDDDLERCNCPKAGKDFHVQCGWDLKRDMPNFILGVAPLDWPKEYLDPLDEAEKQS